MRGAILISLIITLLMASCNDDFGEKSVDPGDFQPGAGVFIVNEGNFGQGNGSISFYGYDDTSIVHDVFRTVNERPLGDLPVSMSISGNRFFITVNHSGRVETGSSENMKSRFTLAGLPSPRHTVIIDQDEAVISDLQSSEIRFFDPESGTQTSSLDIGHSSEAMIISGKRLFLSDWSSFYVNTDNRYVMVVDIENKVLTDSIEVGKEPQSIVRDYQGRIWVLCSGGYDNSEFPVLTCFDPLNLQIIKWFEFSTKSSSPSQLRINGTLDTLYYLEADLYSMPVDDTSLPSQPFIHAGSNSFYGLGVDPLRGDIFLSDALDYQQRGFVWRYKRSGVLVQKMRAGIIPGSFCFN